MFWTLLSASESDPRRKGNSSSLAGRIRNDRRTVMRQLIVLLGACFILAAGAAFAVVPTITPAFALTAVQSAAHDIGRAGFHDSGLMLDQFGSTTLAVNDVQSCDRCVKSLTPSSIDLL